MEAATITNLAWDYETLIRPDFWRSHFSDLTINQLASSNIAKAQPRANVELDKIAWQVRVEGYFQERDDVLESLCPRMERAVFQLVEMGLPPAFLFVFDESWLSFYRQHDRIAHLIGANYKLLPDFWAWHVDPAKGEAGWVPHRDKGKMSLLPDGSPLSLTMWLPLNEATPLNGCMYLLPADRDPVYNQPNEDDWKVDFASIRALPAKPGDVLCWNQSVLHWGARSSTRAHTPRVSMALEFQRGDIPPYNPPLFPPHTDLPFLIRLKLVAKQILQYNHMYALSPELQQIALKILRTQA